MTLLRLQASTLSGVRSTAALPQYDHNALKPGIVHLGLGAFHRAHQAVFTEQAIASSGGDWGIIGVSLRSNTVARQLLPQDCLYCVMTSDASSQRVQVVGAICDVLVAPAEPQRVVEAIARPDIHIVTLTITEKGYCLGADGRTLDTKNTAVAADLCCPTAPQSALGLLALGLRQRALTGGNPLTVISCDNLSGNGEVLHGVVSQYLALSFPEVQDWLTSAVAFPCSMVDRIVPAMTEEVKAQQAALLGLQDEGAVSTEPFIQWIIEDSFKTDRPDWSSAGVQFVADIKPYEEIKLRLLNASHSAIAYIGLLAGQETVADVVSHPILRRYVEALMRQELMSVLEAPAAFDLSDYCQQLLDRFSNPNLRHRCAQIAMDGTEKIGQRWLLTLRANPRGILLHQALGAWCYFVLSTSFAIDDVRSEQLLIWRSSDAPTQKRLRGVLSCARITPDSIASFEALCAVIEDSMSSIEREGIEALLVNCLVSQE